MRPTRTGRRRRWPGGSHGRAAVGRTGGIYIIWHAGVRPEWVYAAKSNDLAADLDSIQDNEDLMYYDSQGGLFVTWALIRPEYQDGVLSYLYDNMAPLVENPNPPKKKTKRLPVLLPTGRSEKEKTTDSKG